MLGFSAPDRCRFDIGNNEYSCHSLRLTTCSDSRKALRGARSTQKIANASRKGPLVDRNL